MGQYYRVVNLTKKEFMYPRWIKLMEHSWVGNSCLMAVTNLLSPGNPWHKTKLVWAGDYMDEGLFIRSKKKTLYREASDKYKEVSIEIPDGPDIYIFVNHTKKEYFDLRKLDLDAPDGTIHPLSILTSSGNGRGGGDYRPIDEESEEYVGTWAGDIISAEFEIPSKYKEIFPNFKEK